MPHIIRIFAFYIICTVEVLALISYSLNALQAHLQSFVEKFGNMFKREHVCSTILLICAIFVTYILDNCSCISEDDSGIEAKVQLGSSQYEEIRGSVEYSTGQGLRSKRSFPIYTCERKNCNGNVCKPETYNGPHPPDWCKHTPHKQETKCSWTTSCINKQCEIQSTSCHQDYEGLRNNGSPQQKSTFNFECFNIKNVCYVEKCKGVTNCGEKTSISMQEFENTFVKGLPKCNDVDLKGRKRRGAWRKLRSINEIRSRWTRTPASVLALTGYCCEAAERWPGVTVAVVRPIRGLSGR